MHVVGSMWCILHPMSYISVCFQFLLLQVIWQDNVDPDNMTYEVCSVKFVMVFSLAVHFCIFITSIEQQNCAHICLFASKDDAQLMGFGPIKQATHLVFEEDAFRVEMLSAKCQIYILSPAGVEPGTLFRAAQNLSKFEVLEIINNVCCTITYHTQI